MMATVPHVTSGLGLRKFQADGFLLTRVYMDMTSDFYQTPNISNQQTLTGALMEIYIPDRTYMFSPQL